MKITTIILIIFLCSCGGSPESRVYVTGKRIIPENETTSEQTEYCLFIKRVDGTKFFFNTAKERTVIVDRGSYDKLNIGDTLKNKY